MILEKLLDSLPSTGLSKVNVVHAKLGLPSPLPSGYFDAASRVSPSCFEAIMTTLVDCKLLVSPDFADAISSCFEIFYRLTKAQADEIQNKLALYSIMQLRCEDFWYKQILLLNSILDGVDDTNCTSLMQSVSWILKCVSSELVSLAGIHQHTSIFPAQPLLHDKLFASIFFKPGILEKLIFWLPIKKCRIEQIAVSIPEELVCRSKRHIYGAAEVVEGYELLDCESLLASVTNEGLEDHADDIRLWANQWNAFVLHECALTHLTYSIAQTLSCGLSSYQYASVKSISDNWSGWRIIVAAANRISAEDYGTDDSYSEMAICNLALTALLATEMNLSMQVAVNNDVDACAACYQLAQAIVSSGANVDDSLVIRRTSRLASALFLIARHWQGEVVGNTAIFMEAALVLAQLSVSPNMPESENAIARKTLLVIIEQFCKNESEDSTSFMLSVLLAVNSSGSQVLQSLISAILQLDVDIPVFLARIATIPNGTNILLKYGVMNSLEKAASAVSEGAKERFNYMAGSGTRKLLRSHLMLMNAMMASLSHVMLRDKMHVHSSILSILERYENIAKPLLLSFPTDVDTIGALINCLALVKEGGSVSSVTGMPSQSYIQERFMRPVATVVFKIASSLTSMLSICLREATRNNVLATRFDFEVAVQDNGERVADLRSVLNNSDDPVKFSQNALNSMLMGVSLVRDSQELFRMDVVGLCGAIDGSVKALRLVHSYVSHIQDWSQVGSKISRSSISEIQLKLGKAVVDLLGVLVSRYKNEATPREVTSVLEHTGLSKSDVGLLGSQTFDENTAEFVRRLTSLLIKSSK